MLKRFFQILFNFLFTTEHVRFMENMALVFDLQAAVNLGLLAVLVPKVVSIYHVRNYIFRFLKKKKKKTQCDLLNFLADIRCCVQNTPNPTPRYILELIFLLNEWFSVDFEIVGFCKFFSFLVRHHDQRHDQRHQ